MRIHNVLGHSFAPDLLSTAKLAIDGGANHGEFARWLSEHTPAEVHSFEPDPRLFAKLPVLPRVTYHPVAIDGESGEFDLGLGEASCSSALYREKSGQTTVRVKKTSLDDFCRQRGIQRLDFLKIDIEGAELNLLEKTSESLLRATTQITVEFHDFIRKEDTPRIEAIYQKLTGLGFYGLRFSQFAWTDCWFLNQAYVPLSAIDKASIHLGGRLAPGLKRFVKRKLGSGTW